MTTSIKLSIKLRIAAHLNTTIDSIQEVHQWDKIYLVLFTTGSPRFVSKSVTMMNNPNSFLNPTVTAFKSPASVVTEQNDSIYVIQSIGVRKQLNTGWSTNLFCVEIGTNNKRILNTKLRGFHINEHVKVESGQVCRVSQADLLLSQ